jgi:serine phosphatase RsbU (regulator of sigma subunit)/anti-sigma regulatory factor (Ser/Thr protein kinase)
MRAAIGAGTGFDFEFRLRNAASATYAWFLCRGSVARDGAGAPVRWFGTLTEIEEQKRAEQRESFLARATETFGASLDLAKTLHAVARFAVPVLGIWSRAEIFGVDGSPGAVADSAPDASSERVVVERMGAPGNLSSAILDRLALGEYALVLDPTDALRGEAVVAYPIFAREEVVGVLHVVVAADFGERSEEARLGRAYARRAAIALERARLYERERRIADTLQRAMLPADLPTRSDVIFSAVYAAASESERVGGDFYDAFDVPDGRIAIVIGDVAGHGLHAAVTMGEVRQSIRAAAFETASPSQVLDRSSRLFVASGRSGMVTAVMSFFDPATRRLTYATAGHPAPLLRIGTTVERLGGDGLPLGLRDGTTFDVSVVVPPGAALAYFTDGLIEFDRDVVGGEQLVEAAFAASGDVAPADAAEAVRELVLGDRAAADDVAILIMTLAERTADEPAATSARAWHFHATDRRTAWLARRAFSRFAATVLDAERADDAELVYGELLANVVQHAPGLVSVAAGAEPDGRFAIVFEDDGPGFDYEPQVAGDDAEHGRGWAIIARLASTLAVERLERGSRASVQLNGANAARTES